MQLIAFVSPAAGLFGDGDNRGEGCRKSSQRTLVAISAR